MLDWTKNFDYAAEPPRHLRHRPVAAALSHDSDGDGASRRVATGLVAPMHHVRSMDTARQ